MGRSTVLGPVVLAGEKETKCHENQAREKRRHFTHGVGLPVFYHDEKGAILGEGSFPSGASFNLWAAHSQANFNGSRLT